MGEMADYALEQVYQDEEDRFSYRMGQMSVGEAYDIGIIDELGAEYTPKIQSQKDLWFSGGQSYTPSEMTEKHLVNAIQYATKNNITTNIVSLMKQELDRRRPNEFK